MSEAREVVEAFEAWPGTLSAFTTMLDRSGVRYLSFSQVSALRSCPLRYLLQYVAKVEVEAAPWMYKGAVLHEGAASLHRARRRGRRVSLAALTRRAQRDLDEDAAQHVVNALRLMSRQVEADWEVVAVEAPFALELAPDLPALLGVIDLVERRGRAYRVIDHKGCRTFADRDAHQLLLYREYVKRRYGPSTCEAYFDEYRWVADLERIRKPAHRRTGAGGAFRSVVSQMRTSFRQMQRIEKEGAAAPSGECFACHLREQCPGAKVAYW